MKFAKWVVLSGALLACQAHAAMVDFLLTSPTSAKGQQGNYADELHYQKDGLSLTVTGWSSGGDKVRPFAEAERAKVGLWNDGLGVESKGLSHTVDNLVGDFDYLVFEFDRAVVLNSVSIGYIGWLADSDVSTGAEVDFGWVWTGDIQNASYGQNPANLGGVSSTKWMVAAYNPFFSEGGSWLLDDAFKVDGISVTPVPLPAGAWLLLSGAAGFIGWRRKVASRANS